MFNRPKKYLEMLIHREKGYFATDAVAEEIREILRKNPQLGNVKLRIEFFATRCSMCGKELSAATCYEYRGKTCCGSCKGAKNDYCSEPARRFQL